MGTRLRDPVFPIEIPCDSAECPVLSENRYIFLKKTIFLLLRTIIYNVSPLFTVTLLVVSIYICVYYCTSFFTTFLYSTFMACVPPSMKTSFTKSSTMLSNAEKRDSSSTR